MSISAMSQYLNKGVDNFSNSSYLSGLTGPVQGISSLPVRPFKPKTLNEMKDEDNEHYCSIDE